LNDCADANWTPDPCSGDAGWIGATICRRPYSVGPYDVGPYGRCQIIGGAVWGQDAPCLPFAAQAPAAPSPWRRAHG
jgi:hypothetical protein